MQQTYTVVIERDPESDWLIGDVVELPGCHTEAPDLQSLEVNITEAIKACLQAVTLTDDELPNEFVGTMRVTVPIDLTVHA